MKFQYSIGCFFVAWLFTWGAYAVSENTVLSELVVRDKVERAQDTGRRAQLLQREEARRVAASERAEKIRNLPAEQVATWNASDRSDEVLNRLSSVSRVVQSPDVIAIPKSHLVRLGVMSCVVVLLSVVFWRRRHAERMANVKKKDAVSKSQWPC